MQRSSVSATLAVLAAGLLWGTVGPAEILAHSQASPVAVGGARILSGGLVLAVITLIGNRAAFRTLPRDGWPSVLAASAATATFQGTFLTSAARTGAAVATAVTFGIAPVSTGLYERIMLGTRLPRRWAAGTACAVAGCALISASQGAGPAGHSRADIFGIACGVVAGGCFGVYTVSAKRLISGNVNMLAAVPVTLLVGGAFLAPWTVPGLSRLAAPRSLALAAWLGPVTVALAYWLYVAGLGRLTAATAATLSLAEPLVATALGTSVLHERLSLPIAAGALLLLGGLVLVSVRPPRYDYAHPPSEKGQDERGTGRGHGGIRRPDAPHHERGRAGLDGERWPSHRTVRRHGGDASGDQHRDRVARLARRAVRTGMAGGDDHRPDRRARWRDGILFAAR